MYEDPRTGFRYDAATFAVGPPGPPGITSLESSPEAVQDKMRRDLGLHLRSVPSLPERVTTILSAMLKYGWTPQIAPRPAWDAAMQHMLDTGQINLSNNDAGEPFEVWL